MNRETKRRLKKQGQLGDDGSPAAPSRPPRAPRPAAAGGGARGGGGRGEGGGPIKRTGAFLGDVRGELRKVAWPSRDEVQNYSAVVFLSLVVIIALIFVLDLTFSKSVIFLFRT